MTPIIHVPQNIIISEDCAKCHAPASDRHHKGCEHMWVEQWKVRRAGEHRYQRFVERYWEFRREDWIPLCRPCHHEIHVLYFLTIGKVAQRLGALKDWSWPMAQDLMIQLRLECDRWLKLSQDS